MVGLLSRSATLLGPYQDMSVVWRFRCRGMVVAT